MDIAAIKARLAALSQKGNGKKSDIWKPTDEHDVRFVPHSYGKDNDYFVELHFHYDIGNETVLCPKKNFGDDCEICDFCDLLYSWNDPDGNEKPEAERKADFEMFKKIATKNSFFAPLVVRSEEAKGAKWHRLSKTTYGELLSICANEENNTMVIDGGGAEGLDVLFSPVCAFDVHVSYKKKGEKGNAKNFNLTEYSEKKRPTPLAKDKAAVEAILKSVKPIGEVYPRVTSAEASKAFKKFVGSGAAEAKPEGGTEKYGSAAPTNSGESAKNVGTRNIDEAFDDLVNEG